MTDPGGCEKCKPKEVTEEEAALWTKVEAGASKTGLRPALQFQFGAFGLLLVVFLYTNLVVQLVNVLSVTIISCRYKQKSPVRKERT